MVRQQNDYLYYTVNEWTSLEKFVTELKQVFFLYTYQHTVTISAMALKYTQLSRLYSIASRPFG